MAFGLYITDAGRNLLMNLQIGDAMNISRVMVGNGIPAEGMTDADFETMTDLINPVSPASSTAPVVNNNILDMTIIYDNTKPYAAAEDFNITEYGIFARNASNNEILIYYATIADSPEPVKAYDPTSQRITIRKYPVSIVLDTGEINATLDFDPEGVTFQDLWNIVELSSNDIPKFGVKLHYYITGSAEYYRPDIEPPDPKFAGAYIQEQETENIFPAAAQDGSGLTPQLVLKPKQRAQQYKA